eukprot:TRINITY_DN6547_c0_g1_i11.p1 TRINITY_DN6547_c0_g1~~TRINITY_DN6547_c0_g1_i11.p1  ORF type:complete len:634 (-),score=64.73 TRINITY_DN6547_c0_g1_i11:454-2355(-)
MGNKCIKDIVIIDDDQGQFQPSSPPFEKRHSYHQPVLKPISLPQTGYQGQQSAPEQIQAQDGEDFDQGVPVTFICPLTQEIMTDPVVVADSGNVYERKAISDWFKLNDRDPLTNLVVKNKQLIPLHILKSDIEDFQSRRQQFRQYQSQLQKNQLELESGNQSVGTSAQFIAPIEQTTFQKTIDEFGEAFVFLFRNISRKKSVYLDYKSVFTDQRTRKAVINLPDEIDQIDKDIRKLQDEYDAITENQNATDTSKEIGKIATQTFDLKNQKEEKLAKLEVAQKVRELLDTFFIAGSVPKIYACIQQLGLKPTKYVLASSTLMGTTARFEKSVIVLQAVISNILGKEVKIEELSEELQKARSFQQNERKMKSDQLRSLLGSESSLDNVEHIKEEYDKADAIFTHLQKSADEVERSYNEFLKTLSDFELSLGLRPESEQAFIHMLQRGGNVRNAKLNLGFYKFKTSHDLSLSGCEITGAGGCLTLEAEGQSISIVNCSFNRCGIVLKGFSGVDIQGVSVTSSPYNGIYICNAKKASAFNTVTTNSGSKFQDYSGLYFDNIEMVDTKQCKSSGNSGSGFVFSRVQRCNVTQCTAANNGKAGIGFWNKSTASVGECTITSNRKYTIYNDQSSNVHMRE